MRFTNLLLAIPLLLTLAACDQKPATPTEQIKDKVGDALDTRPHENIRDAGEDLGEGIKDAAEDLKK